MLKQRNMDMFGVCLKYVWSMSGVCREYVRNLSGQCREYFGSVSREPWFVDVVFVLFFFRKSGCVCLLLEDSKIVFENNIRG